VCVPGFLWSVKRVADVVHVKLLASQHHPTCKHRWPIANLRSGQVESVTVHVGSTQEGLSKRVCCSTVPSPMMIVFCHHAGQCHGGALERLKLMIDLERLDLKQTEQRQLIQSIRTSAGSRSHALRTSSAHAVIARPTSAVSSRPEDSTPFPLG
jgi:hypothetical protein